MGRIFKLVSMSRWWWPLTIPIYLLIDAPFLLFLSKSVHMPQIERMTSGSPLRRAFWPAAILFYLAAPWALLYLVLDCATSTREAVARGAVLGAAMYGTYDLTLLAILGPDLYPIWYATMDIAWGTFAMATVSLVMTRIARLPW
jgi:uncharacterized membrane protein